MNRTPDVDRRCPYHDGVTTCDQPSGEGTMWCPVHERMIMRAILDRRHQSQAQDAAQQEAQAMRDLDARVHSAARRQEIWDHRNDEKPEAAVGRFENAVGELKETLANFKLPDINLPQQPQPQAQPQPQPVYRRRGRPGAVFDIVGGAIACVVLGVIGFFAFAIGACIFVSFGGADPTASMWFFGVIGALLVPVLTYSWHRGDNARLSAMDPQERSDDLWRREYRRRTRMWGYGMFGGRRW